jgi:HEAT repeat protein
MGDRHDDLELSRRVRRARKERDADTLIAALDDEIEATVAARYLGEIGAIAAIPALTALLDAANPQHRAQAALALGTLKGEAACARIMRMAEQDDVPWVRACATEAVGHLRCDGGELLLRALDDSDIRVRRIAVVALMESGHADAIPVLRAARRREHWYSRMLYGKAIRRLKRAAR